MTDRQHRFLNDILFECMKWQEDLDLEDQLQLKKDWQRFQQFSFEIDVEEASDMIEYWVDIYDDILDRHYPPWRYRGMKYIYY